MDYWKANIQKPQTQKLSSVSEQDRLHLSVQQMLCGFYSKPDDLLEIIAGDFWVKRGNPENACQH